MLHIRHLLIHTRIRIEMCTRSKSYDTNIRRTKISYLHWTKRLYTCGKVICQKHDSVCTVIGNERLCVCVALMPKQRKNRKKNSTCIHADPAFEQELPLVFLSFRRVFLMLNVFPLSTATSLFGYGTISIIKLKFAVLKTWVCATATVVYICRTWSDFHVNSNTVC